jgi:uncharacterized protein
MNPLPILDQPTLARLCEQHHVRRLSLFGSQLKGMARPDGSVGRVARNPTSLHSIPI